ncbi:PrsW family intramembrane metalloprotease [Butyrivibrio sp. X503]|uniref:PrsW family glutamic-type intramembrane protease n=1 Tax=Butyrivibrio sp. X503 TaxID=2364878 RepID=UPI000EA89D36|nr:PrsW family glutamic-type intramembrane protease [Butyrivibrio sp. X503]RKM53904.1 PrsW family intramembrane metalloprotease [Butyrivibrio sp. X503]
MTILAILAVLPAAVLLYVIYKADNVEKEPFSLMALVFFLGLLTTISAMFMEQIGTFLLNIVFMGNTSNLIYTFILTFFVVGVAEEGGKYFVLKKSTWNNKEFNFSFDGIVYSVCSSLGFATLENILYVVPGGFHVGVMRAILSVPGHCIFGVFMGVYYGLAKGNELRGNIQGMKMNLRKAFWIPVAIHGFYDFCLMAEMEILLLAFIGLEIFMVVRAIKMIKLMSKTDTPLIPGVTAQEAINIRNMQAMQQANPAQFQQAMGMQAGMAPNMQQPFNQMNQGYAQNMQQFSQGAAQQFNQFNQGAAQQFGQFNQNVAQNAQQFGQMNQNFAQNSQQQFGQFNQGVAQNAQQFGQGVAQQFGQNVAQNVQQPVNQTPTQQASGYQNNMNVQQPYTQVQNGQPVSNTQTTGGAKTEELFDQDPAIIIQNEPLDDGLSNPNPVFTATDLT